jgi:hypothetical protein
MRVAPSPVPEHFHGWVMASPAYKDEISGGGWHHHPPLEIHFQGRVMTPPPAPKNTHKNLDGFLPPPDSSLLAQGGAVRKSKKKKKRGWEVLNLISLKLGVLASKLILIPCIF